MRLRDYFAGLRLSLVSPLEPGEVERRINRAVDSILNPFAGGVAGWARLGVLRLHDRSETSHVGEPVLAGRIRRDGAGARLDLVYRAPLIQYLFYLLWYLCAGSIFIMVWADGAGMPERLLATLAVLFFLVLPIATHRVTSVGDEGALDDLVAFLERVAEAKRVR